MPTTNREHMPLSVDSPQVNNSWLSRSEVMKVKNGLFKYKAQCHCDYLLCT